MTDNLREKIEAILSDIYGEKAPGPANLIMELITSTLEDIEIEHTKETEEAYRAGQLEELERAEKQSIYQGISANPKYAISSDYIADRLAELEGK